MVRALLFYILILGIPTSSFALSGITYHGRIMNPDNSVVVDANVQFKMQILTPDGNSCVMYEETQTKDLSASQGAFAITINDGTGSATQYGYSFNRVFANYGTFALSPAVCGSGAGTYTPSSGDSRAFIVSFKTSTMTSWEQMPTQTINFAPMAIEANQVAGFPGDTLLRVDSGTGPTAIRALTSAEANAVLDLADGTSTKYVQSTGNGASLPSLSSNPSSPAAGDVWYDSVAKTLKFYDGASVQLVGAGSGPSGTVTQIIAGTGLSGGTITTSGTISMPNVGSTGTYTKVTTDAQGRVTTGAQITGSDITSGTIGGTTAIDTSGQIKTTGNVIAANVSSTVDSTETVKIFKSGSTTDAVSITAPASLTSGGYSLVLPPNQAAGVLISDASGNLSWTTASTGTVTNVTGTAPVSVASGTSTPVVSMHQADSTHDGYLSSADWTTFNSKLDAGSSITLGTTSVALGATATSLAGLDSVTVGKNGTTTGQFILANGAASGAATTIQPSSSTTTAWTMTLPPDKGTSGYFLKTDGSGATSWAQPAAALPSLADDNIWIGQSGAATAVSMSGDATISNSGVLSIASNAITTTKINNLAVTDAKINDVLVSKITNAASTYFGYKPNNTACTDQQVLKWDSSNGWVCADDIGASGIVASVAVTAPITNSGTSTAPNLGVSAATTSATGVVQLASDNGTTAGTVVQATDTRLANSRAPTGTAGGDLSGTYPSPTLAKINSVPLSISSLTSGNFLRYDGSNWTNVSLSSSDITTALGFTPSSSSSTLGVAGGGTGATTFTAHGVLIGEGTSAVSATSAGTSGYLLTGGGASADPTFAQLNLATSAAITGTLPVANGGTGVTSLAGTFVLNGGQAGTVTLGSTDANTVTVKANNSTAMTILSSGKVGIGTTTPAYSLDVRNASNQAHFSSTDVDSGLYFVALGPSQAYSGIGATYNGTNWIAKDTTAILTGGTSGGYSVWSDTGLTAGNTYTPTARLTVAAGGNVGIGTTSPSVKLEVVGDVKAASFISTSDRRLKTNITSSTGLETILQLNGVQYDWIRDGRHDHGVIAQEVEAVMPDAVVTDAKSGMKAVKYQSLISPLIQSTKELYGMCRAQDVKIEQLQRSISSLENENRMLKERLQRIEKQLGLDSP